MYRYVLFPGYDLINKTYLSSIYTEPNQAPYLPKSFVFLLRGKLANAHKSAPIA